MAQIIALLTAVAGLLYALDRLGIAPASLNPFAWWRRVQWNKTYGGKPLYKLSDPIDLASVLLLGVAKCKGALTTAQREAIRTIFIHKLKQTPKDADDLLVSAAFLTRDEVYVSDSIDKILELSRRVLTAEQKSSLLNLMQEVARVDGPPNDEQQALVHKTFEILNQK